MPQRALSSVNVLVVEDEPFTRETVTALLGRIGVGAVLSAANGAAALALLESVDIDIHLAICDIEMPELSGYEFVRRLRYGSVPRYKELPVLMLTGHDTPKNLERARTHRIAGFLVKPPTAESLRLGILEALPGRS